MINPSRKHWSLQLVDALLAYHTAYKIPLGMSLYHIVYGKVYHLPVEIKYKIYWVIKTVNLDLNSVDPLQKLQLNELEELICDAY